MSEVEVATAGSVERSDRCASCGEPMLYRMGGVENKRIVSSFCGNLGSDGLRSDCPASLLEIPE